MIALIVTQLRHRLATAATLGLLAMLTVAAAVAVPLYTGEAREYAVSSRFAQATTAERSVAITATVPATSGVGQAVERVVDQLPQRPAEEPYQTVAGAAIPGAVGDAAIALVARDGFCDHLEIEGRCPQHEREVVVSDAARPLLDSATFGFRVSDSDDAQTLTIVGVYRAGARTATDPYWAARADLTPIPLRATNPVFTTMATLDRMPVEVATATVDLVLTAPPAHAPGLGPITDGEGYDVRNGVPGLLTEIEAARGRLSVSAPLGAATMLLLAFWTLLLTAGGYAARLRAEPAVAALRGAPRRHRFLLLRGGLLLVVALAAGPGLLLGWLMVFAVTRLAWAPERPPVLTPGAALWGVGAALIALIAVSFVDRRRVSLESWRRVPSRRGRTGLAFDTVVVVLALAAASQALATGEGTGIALAAPILAAAAIGLLATRLARPLAATIGQSRIYRGHLGSGLAALALSRRGGAAQALTLVVLCLAQTGYAVAGWQRLSGDAARQATDRLGAATVVDVAAPSRPALLAAVRRADPQGAWAMAAARERLPQGRDLVALDLSRASSILDLPVTAQLLPAVNAPLELNGAELVLDIAVTQAVAPVTITAALSASDGATFTVPVEIPATVGRTDYRLPTPQCTRATGCRLAWLSFSRSPQELRLHRIGQLGPDRELAGPEAIAAPARFRSAFELENEVTLHYGDDSLWLTYRPSDPRRVSRDIRLQVADAPVPTPVAIDGDPGLVHSGGFREAAMLAGGARPVTVVSAGRLPGIPDNGVLVDLVFADRLSDSFGNSARLQVWLGPQAPPDALERLSAAGATPLWTESVRELTARWRLSPDALGLRLQLFAALLSILLAALAIAALGAADRAERAGELVLLAEQGLAARTVRRVAHRGQTAVVLAALVPATPACVAVWVIGDVRPGWQTLAALGAAVLALTAVAYRTDHKLWRAVKKP